MRIFYPLLYTVIVMTIAHENAIGEGDFNIHSIKREEEALLKFKDSFKNPSNQFSSWDIRRDFCSWAGVECTSTTGHVISLDLHYANSFDKLQGELSLSLLELPYLSSLDLSGNNFMQSKVPAFLGSMHNLKHLNLSGANFKGKLPDNIGNLSRLESLDLSDNGFSLTVNNLSWLHGLSSLKFLDLSGVDLSSSANDWFRAISMLPSLAMLRLSGCQLHNLPPSPPEVNFDSLITLDLSTNHFKNTIPDWLFENCHNLQHLNLSNNQLQGPIPDSIERPMSLAILDLSNNYLSGPIPSTLGQTHSQNDLGIHSSLKELHLSNNNLSGRIEERLVQFSELIVLDVAQNDLKGIISDSHLRNFSSLRVLDFSSNHLIWNVSKNWTPSFKLETIGLRSVEIGPQFPNWLQSQKNLSFIDLSDANISGSVPDWFWNLSPRVEYMNLSHNTLSGCSRLTFSSNFKLHTLDLSDNNFSCPLPHFNPNMKTVKLDGNSFFGPMSHVCDILGDSSSLSYLDLSKNLLSGNIPDCWTNGSSLVVLDLSHNSFTGQIPDSFGNLVRLSSLNLNSNNLSGQIPVSLQNCVSLYVLDVGVNKLSGNIPTWIGESVQYAKVLIFRSNAFEGNIPLQLCQLKLLSILDVAENHLSGSIPPCLFDVMAVMESDIYDPYNAYRQSMMLLFEIFRRWSPELYILNDMIFFKSLDLSSNELNGNIPREIAKMNGLVALNLSRNQLVGSIPSSIGELKDLEVVDLSMNQLSCAIPTSMVDLYFLAYLNLSYNNLSGEIPRQYQFMTFDMSSYQGNPNLCGVPLATTCPRNKSFEDLHCSDTEKNREYDGIGNHEDNREGLGISSFYISMGIGFFAGFWLFWGSLVLFTSWRYAYFRFLGNMNDRIYVTIAVAVAKLRRKFQSQHVPQ